MSESEPAHPSPFIATVKSVGLYCLFFCLLLTGFCMISWYEKGAHPIDLPYSYNFMLPITGITFLPLIFIVFLLLQGISSGLARFLINLISVLIVIVICIKLFQFFTNTQMGYNFVVFQSGFSSLFKGTMAPVTAISFLILTMTLLMLNRNNHIMTMLSGYLITLFITINVVVVVGYLFGTPLLYSYTVYGNHITPMSLSTAICFILIGVAVIAKIGALYFPLKPLMEPSTKGQLLRAFVPLIFVFVLADGVAYALLPAYFHFNPALVPAIMALMFIGTASLVIYRVANKIGS
jgi:hypothetical protein